jgi:hypothetical protein
MRSCGQLAEDEEAMWRSAAHHAPRVTTVVPEPTTTSLLYALYAQQMIQQVALSRGDGASGSAADGWVDGL